MNKKNRQGFTLIELSISLVIIGLIVGGILGVRDLIRQAEIRSVISDISGFNTAINTFSLKYNYLPGDMPNASSYWSGANNGNGSGTLNTYTEGKYAWQHLGLSGLIPGNYSGVHQGPPVLGVDVPTAPMDGAGYTLYTAPSGDAAGTVIHFGTIYGSTTLTGYNVLTPAEAKSIDDKIDNGIPRTGKVFAVGGWDGSASDPDCLDGAGTTQTYELDNDTIECRLDFLLNLQ